ncbi:hypothetical protein CRUP_003250, partial [Coryphaenoides rupestris]
AKAERQQVKLVLVRHTVNTGGEALPAHMHNHRSATQVNMARSMTEDEKKAVPFRGHIKDGLRIGKRIIVVGVVGSRPDR